MIKPFCDYLAITVPAKAPYMDAHAALRVEKVIEIMGPAGVGERPEEGFWNVGGSTFTHQLFGRVIRMSWTGDVLRALAAADCLARLIEYLSRIEHRVTRIDVSADLEVAYPGGLIRDFYEQHKDGAAITRKKVPVTLMGWCVGPDGRETGTVYIGESTAKTRGMIYDKTKQMAVEKHQNIGRSIARYEFKVKDNHGVTLRDVVYPEELFWHLAVPVFFAMKPAAVSDWVPGMTGFLLDARNPVSPRDRYRRYVGGALTIDIAARLAVRAGRDCERDLLTYVRSAIERQRELEEKGASVAEGDVDAPF